MYAFGTLPSRQAYFELIHALLTAAKSSLEGASQGVFGEAGGAMAQGFLDAFEGEKDPRVLLTCLRTSALLHAALAQHVVANAGGAGAVAGALAGDGDGRSGAQRRSKQRQIDVLSLRDGRTWGESMVDILSMYFPITFKPPPNDPYGITQVHHFESHPSLHSPLNPAPS